MLKVYQEVLKCIQVSGQRIVKKAGRIKDIGITKKDLTEEDLRIERELKSSIKKNDASHEVFAEEENNTFLEAENVWVVDPISGTNIFIHGELHYAIVVAHLYQHKVQFAAVYDPSIDELFTAYRGKGSYLNEKPIKVSTQTAIPECKFLFVYTHQYNGEIKAKDVYKKLSQYTPYRIRASFALQYCYVACGRYDGLISFTKDMFPEVAGGFIIQEAGGTFTNDKEKEKIEVTDRVFIAGNKIGYETAKSMLTRGI